jgi:hypothetical protein
MKISIPKLLVEPTVVPIEQHVAIVRKTCVAIEEPMIKLITIGSTLTLPCNS